MMNGTPHKAGVKAYLAQLRVHLLLLFQYRAAALAGLATQVFWGLIKVMILTAFYSTGAAAGAASGMTLEEAITFTWLAQALLMLAPWRLDKDIEKQIRTGNVAYELVRPLDLYWLWFFKSLAFRLMPTLLRSLPIFVLAGLFFELKAPVSLAAALAFLFSLCLAALVSAAITCSVVISLFWTISGEGIQRLIPPVVLLFSGMVVPLPLFPDWMQPFISAQPLRAVLDIPSRLYTGMIALADAPQYFAFQLAWLFAFVLLGRFMLALASRRLVIQGG